MVTRRAERQPLMRPARQQLVGREDARPQQPTEFIPREFMSALRAAAPQATAPQATAPQATAPQATAPQAEPQAAAPKTQLTGNPNVPRGYRNNNPLNIIDGSFARGQPGYEGTDGRFGRFASMDDGINAADRLLQSYADRGLNTPQSIIARWAPAGDGDNNPSAYAATIARNLGVEPGAAIDMANPAVRRQLIDAMAAVENGRPMSPPKLADGGLIDLARKYADGGSVAGSAQVYDPAVIAAIAASIVEPQGYAEGGQAAPTSSEWDRYLPRDLPDSAYGDLQQNLKYLPLNYPFLLNKGAIRITQPGSGDENNPHAINSSDPEKWSLVSAYNDLQPNSVTRGWASKPESYESAIKILNNPGGLYDGKYRQILQSARELGLRPDEVFMPEEKTRSPAARGRGYADGGTATGASSDETAPVPEQVQAPRTFADLVGRYGVGDAMQVAAPLDDQSLGAGVLRKISNYVRPIVQGNFEVPGTVKKYAIDVATDPNPFTRLGRDIGTFGSNVWESVKENPVGTALDLLPVVGNVRSAMDADELRNKAVEAEQAGDEDLASMYRQLSAMAVVGAFPLVGYGAVGVKRAASMARDAAARRAGAAGAKDAGTALVVRGGVDDIGGGVDDIGGGGGVGLIAREDAAVRGTQAIARDVAEDVSSGTDVVAREGVGLEPSGSVARRAKAAAARDSAQAAAVVPRNLSPSGFYSLGEETAANLAQAKGTPDQMAAMLRKYGVKPDEFYNTGIADETATNAMRLKIERDYAPKLAAAKLDMDALGLNENTINKKSSDYNRALEIRDSPETKAKYRYDSALNAMRSEMDSAMVLRPEWASRPSVTREELAQHFSERRPQVEETVLGGRSKPEMDDAAKQKWIEDAAAERAYNSGDLDEIRNWGGASDDIRTWHLDAARSDFNEQMAVNPDFASQFQTIGQGGATRFQQYTLPGGENYREIALTLPGEEIYRVPASHSMGEKADVNRIAHIRMTDRTGPNGEKILHLEELQSDWGQKGRTEGFLDPQIKINYDNHIKKLDLATAETKNLMKIASDRLGQANPSFENAVRAVPELKIASDKQSDLYYNIPANPATSGILTAPYVTNTAAWTDLALKRALKEAAEGGYDRLVWTPGAEQVKRYDLSKQIDELAYWREDGNIGLSASGPNGTVFDQHYVSEKDLPGVVGRELAEEILKGKGSPKSTTGFSEEIGVNFISREGLRVGGEGMKAYYDKMVPNQLGKLVKRLDPDAKVGLTDVMLPHETGPGMGHNNPPFEAPGLTITPKMREAIMKGQTDFAEGGSVQGYADGGSASGSASNSLADLYEKYYGDPATRQRLPTYEEMGDNPVGYSSIYPPQYMSNQDPNVSPVASRTLMSDVQRLGLLGRRGPVTGADLPAVEARGQRMMDNAMTVAGAVNPVGIRAFHGSPHTFDRFDMAKLGTGEGAQSYGHGLYFAEREGVAESYLGANTRWTFGGKNADTIYQAAYDKVSRPNAPPSANAEAYFWEQVALGKAPRAVAMEAVNDAANWPELAKYAQSLPLDKFKRKGGSMYEVNLRTSPDRLLDWDKPLSAKSDLRGVLYDAASPAASSVYGNTRSQAFEALTQSRNPNLTGESVHNQLAKVLGGRGQAATALKGTGIDGIRYLDGGSRAAGQGSSNYVMFDDKLIELLRRYGLLGMVGGGAAAAGGKQAPSEEPTDYAQGGSVDSVPVYDPAVIAAIAASITEDNYA